MLNFIVVSSNQSEDLKPHQCNSMWPYKNVQLEEQLFSTPFANLNRQFMVVYFDSRVIPNVSNFRVSYEHRVVYNIVHRHPKHPTIWLKQLFIVNLSLIRNIKCTKGHLVNNIFLLYETTEHKQNRLQNEWMNGFGVCTGLNSMHLVHFWYCFVIWLVLLHDALEMKSFWRAACFKWKVVSRESCVDCLDRIIRRKNLPQPNVSDYS